ncbi:MAG: hypothetical protein Q7K57_32805 [Burkholderiaceae bacterium]|nr:hypothetical protein [Burkholderiaceae bacterium]
MNYITPQFDRSLLSATPEQKLKYFQSKVFRHEHLTQAYNLALDNIEFAPDGEIVPIVGPTGVGTTELGKGLWREYQKQVTTLDENGQVERNANSIGVQAPCQAGRIDADYWKRFLEELLRRGGDILIDRKIYVPPSQFMLTHPIPYSDPRKGGIDTVLAATVSMLERRQTKVVLINQADRLFPEDDLAGCTRSQQILMDLATQTRARLVLIGGYRLIHASCARNNWLRRQHVVHFRRYDKNNRNEYELFVQALTFMLANLPIEQRLEHLSEDGAKKLYIRTVGCVGSLKKTLTMAFQHALRTGEKVTESFLLEFAQHNVVALEIAKETLIGEQLLLDVSTTDVERVLDAGPFALDAADDSAVKPLKLRAKSATGGRRIGERKSTRDPVGNRHEKRA